MNKFEEIDDQEMVTRSLVNAWVEEGVIAPTAFNLGDKETYLSVNRSAIAIYKEDLKDFSAKNHHPEFRYKDNPPKVRVAELNVGKVRRINFKKGNTKLDICVSVIPRASHYKSHAGIYTKSNGVSLYPDRKVKIEPEKLGVSVDSVLQRLRIQLVNLAGLKEVIVQD
jgi:hypothetical protein